MNKPTMLVILDGFGHSQHTRCNAIYHAKMPHYKQLLRQYPHTLLQASGQAVGLLDDYIGNSEVGHLTIGSGRRIQQPITLIHAMINNKTFFKNSILISKLQEISKKNKTLHLMGLLSNAGVHSHQEHLFAFLDAAVQQGVNNIVVHPFLDGRDVPPQSAAVYLQQLSAKLDSLKCGIIGSLHGRFYAMDRDGNWQRTQQSYQVLTQEQPLNFKHWQEVLDYYYAKNITDEFIPPTQLAHTIINDGDGVIFFNVRADRARQLTACFVDPSFNHFPIRKISLTCFITPVPFSDALKTDVLMQPAAVHNTLKEVLDHAGKTMFSIAETEKYAHITYFFNGGKETPLPHEKRMLIPSLHPRNYVDQPQMSAPAITQAVLESLKTDPKDFYLVNYANADMVAHSGNLKATIAAVECLDEQIQKLYEQVVLKMQGTLYITADHGNAEDMYDPSSHQPKTAHTRNPVPFLMISPETKDKNIQLPLKELADIAPFILQHMGLQIPKEMQQ